MSKKPLFSHIPVRRIYVVAGTYWQYECWRRENQLGPGLESVYVADSYRLRGLENPLVIYYGTFGDRQDLDEICAIVHAQMRTV